MAAPGFMGRVYILNVDIHIAKILIVFAKKITVLSKIFKIMSNHVYSLAYMEYTLAPPLTDRLAVFVFREDVSA